MWFHDINTRILLIGGFGNSREYFCDFIRKAGRQGNVVSFYEFEISNTISHAGGIVDAIKTFKPEHIIAFSMSCKVVVRVLCECESTTYKLTLVDPPDMCSLTRNPNSGFNMLLSNETWVPYVYYMCNNNAWIRNIIAQIISVSDGSPVCVNECMLSHPLTSVRHMLRTYIEYMGCVSPRDLDSLGIVRIITGSSSKFRGNAEFLRDVGKNVKCVVVDGVGHHVFTGIK